MIKTARLKKGLSQNKLATILKVNQSYISKIENLKAKSVSVDLVVNLAASLELCPVKVFIFITKCYK